MNKYSRTLEHQKAPERNFLKVREMREFTNAWKQYMSYSMVL